jgi:serine phosphatase RsbU (regulator of sigma subunit)
MGRSLSWTPLLALVVGLIVTAALSVATLIVYNRNERRLLHLRVRELGLVISATVPTVQTPLATAAELADATDGSATKFREFMAAYVGPGRQFASASLWPLHSRNTRPTVLIGQKPLLLASPAQARRLFTGQYRPGQLNLTGIMGSRRPSLGLEFSPPGRTQGFAVYAENPLPANRRSGLERNSAFSDLYYVLYLGHSRRSSNLLVTNVGKLPLRGRQASDVVPFGSASFTLVVAPVGSLGGVFFRDLPWLIGIVGALLSIAAALLTQRLARGRRRAEQLAQTLEEVAAENRELYTEQRSISETLQHALLPDTMPQLDGLQVSALYVPAGSGVDIGGDWYDVVAVDERKAFLIVGDVSGHGLEAATTMALLRHAALAYAAQDSRPASVLARLFEFVKQRGGRGHFATMLCALIDVEGHRLTIASAGHLPPLLLNGGSSAYLELDSEVPIGAPIDHPDYREVIVGVPPDATFVAFTDGLVERRDEVIDVGLARLRTLASQGRLPLAELLTKLTRDLATEDHPDDTAIVGVRWED